MKSKLNNCIAVALFAISCNSDPGQGDKTLMRVLDLEIYETFSTTNYDIWVIVSNASGDIISWKKWSHEPELSLDAQLSPNENVNISFFFGDAHPHGEIVTHTLNAYTNITPGQHWKLGLTNQDAMANLGQCKMTVRDVPPQYNTQSLTAFQSNKFVNISSDCSAGVCSFDLLLFDVEDPVLCSFTPGNVDPVYFKADTLQAGMSYDLDFNGNFFPFDHAVNIPHETNDFVVALIGGVEESRWKLQTVFFSSLTGDQLHMGYNDGFEQYQALYFTSRKGVSYSIRKLANEIKADDFVLPDQDFTVVNNEFGKFTFFSELPKTLESRSSRWSKQETVGLNTVIFNVFVAGGPSHDIFKLNNLLPEIGAAYPLASNLNDLTYQFSTFTFVDGGSDYQAFLQRTFIDPPLQDRLGSFIEITK